MLTTAGCAAKPSSALVSGAIGIVIANGGTSGVATIARTGSAYCSFDASATVVGDYVVPSSTANLGFYALCHEAGATQPSGTQVLGRVLQASAGSSTVQMFIDMPGSNVSSSAAYSIPWLTSNTTGTAISVSSTGWKTLNWTASATLQPGKYYLAITSTCTTGCAQVYGGSSTGFNFMGGPSGASVSVTAGGTLNNGITIPADNSTESTVMAWEIH